MYAGFPLLPVTVSAPPIDEGAQQACKTCTVPPRVENVRLSYPALCHLLHLSKTPSVRFGVFGRLYGVQVAKTVEVGNICMNPPKARPTERESNEERSRRLAEEEERNANDFARLEDMMSEEFFDAYHVGNFVICSAAFNCFSPTMVKLLTDLVTSSQPGVLVTYDPFRTALLGKPYIRAFTLTDEYVSYATKLREKHSAKENRLLKEFGVTRSGVLREVPVELHVDAFHQLGLQVVDAEPTEEPFTAIHSDPVNNYMEALLSTIQENSAKLTKQLDTESKMAEKDHHHSGATGMLPPLGQNVETQLLLFALREQTQHLEALCDSVLLNSSILRDI